MKKKKERRISGDRIRTGGTVAALAAAVAVFAVMIQLEKSVLTQYEKGTIYVAAAQIPRGQMITEENYQQYFVEKQLDKSCIPETALCQPDQVNGLIAVYSIDPGVLLTRGMFEEYSEITGGMKEPVVAGFKAEDIYQVAGGILRAGDRVHIYSVMEEETTLVWKEIFVQQVFDASGAAIPNGNNTAAAQRINVYLDREDVAEFYRELAGGSLRVVKALD
ncbi:MAG: hypothetical protein HFG25_14775 [Lachnospiraceae bacterium]|nr:hypothetical protein [Lachnospiraceae bacterium]